MVPPVSFVRPGTLYAWMGPSLLVVDSRGQCGEAEPLSGYYFREARFLRSFRLEIDGEAPWLSEATSVAPALLTFAYVFPEVIRDEGGGSSHAVDGVPMNANGIPQRALAIRTSYIVTADGLEIAVTVANHARVPVACDLAWHVDADFADIQEAQSGARQQQAGVACDVGDLGLVLAYEHERLRFRASVNITSHGDWHVSDRRLATRITLRPQASVDLGLRLEPSAADGSAINGNGDERARALTAWRSTFARAEIPGNAVAEHIVAANMRDFASFPLLEGEADEWLALQAGMPLYPALFARDTLTAGWQAAWVDRGGSLEASLVRLGRLQSDRTDAWRDEEPGRIPYQVRRGPLAQLDINPYAGYYADFASPFMFVIALAHLYAWTGDKALIQRHWDTGRRILEWARTAGDRNGDGYLEYETRSRVGTKNQGWKDSGDAIVYEDGRPVPSPLGTCELQGYWYAAQELMAFMSWAVGRHREARTYWRNAVALKHRFNRDWWLDDERGLALARDPEGRFVPAVSSNIGHCIATGIVSRDHLRAAVTRLFAPDMFSGWGIRTLSSAHASYSPMSYHCGSVWPVEQTTMAFGLRRFGFDAEALALARAQFDLAQQYPAYRIPECVGGYARGADASPAAFPHANTPQLWNATGFALLVHTILGLQPVGPLGVLVVSPALPEWLPEVVLRDVRLAQGTATLRFWRDTHGRSHAEVVNRRGAFRLLQQPPLESLRAGVGDRLRALFDTVVH